MDLFRFVFPDFKIIQLVSYNRFVDGGWGMLKFPFFNGEGLYLQTPIASGYDPAARDFLRKYFRICHEHREAFRSDSPRPLVATLEPRVFANEFPGGRETVWTLLNSAYRTHRGPVLAVAHEAGATYRDLWHDRPLKPTIRGGRAILSVEIGPREVGCIRRGLPGKRGPAP